MSGRNKSRVLRILEAMEAELHKQANEARSDKPYVNLNDSKSARIDGWVNLVQLAEAITTGLRGTR